MQSHNNRDCRNDKKGTEMIFTSVNRVVQRLYIKSTIDDIHLLYRSCLQYPRFKQARKRRQIASDGSKRPKYFANSACYMKCPPIWCKALGRSVHLGSRRWTWFMSTFLGCLSLCIFNDGWNEISVRKIPEMWLADHHFQQYLIFNGERLGESNSRAIELRQRRPRCTNYLVVLDTLFHDRWPS